MDEVDLDTADDPRAARTAPPRLRRSAGLLATGTVVLACQQVLGPVASTWLFTATFSSSGTSSEAIAQQTAFTVVYFAVFAAGLVMLVIGVVRFASHVHALADLALRRAEGHPEAHPGESAHGPAGRSPAAGAPSPHEPPPHRRSGPPAA